MADISESVTVTTCPHCGASMKQYWHKVTPGIVSALGKFRMAVINKGENRIHLIQDMKGKSFELAPYEWKNWTKVRFNGLVAKYRQNGVWERGYWLLTKRGNDFLTGKIDIPDRVLTFRNQVIDHGSERVSVHDVVHQLDLPYFEELGDIQWQLGAADIEDATGELVQASLL